MSDTAPPPFRLSAFNPTWIAVAVMVLINVASISVKFNAIEEHGQRLKALEVKDASRDVQQAEFRSDLTYIKERLSEIKAAVNAVPAPQAQPSVVYQIPPGYVPGPLPSRRAGPNTP